MKILAIVISLFLVGLFLVDFWKLSENKNFWIHFFDVLIDGGLLIVAAALFRGVF